MKSNVMIARFLRTLDLMDQAGERVPGLMLSHAGFGKTTTVRLYSKYYDYNCVELIPSQYAADDVVGVQVFDSDTHQLVRKAPSWFRRLKELVESNGKRTILFIDEITTCNPYIQGPLLDLIFSRSIGEEKLPENVMVVAAGNYASDLNGEFTMSSPLINRFVLLNLAREDFDIREVLDGPISTVKTSEDIKKFLDLEESDHSVYDYKAFIDWLYDSKNVDFAKYTPEEIDEINIYEASRKGMTLAIKNLSVKPDYIITDCMPLKEFPNLPVEAIVKGDAKAMCVAAASILAKVTRDRIMDELDKKYPEYNIKKHKGYPTKEHLELLKKYGPIKGLYRYSYRPVLEARVEKITLF